MQSNIRAMLPCGLRTGTGLGRAELHSLLCCGLKGCPWGNVLCNTRAEPPPPATATTNRRAQQQLPVGHKASLLQEQPQCHSLAIARSTESGGMSSAFHTSALFPSPWLCAVGIRAIQMQGMETSNANRSCP